MPYGGTSSAQGYYPFKSVSVLNVAQQVQNYPNGAGAQRGNIGGGLLQNTVGSARYVKFYDKATAPVVGTDIPKWTVQVPANSTIAMPTQPLFFNLGIWVAATQLPADSDNTAPSAGDVIVALEYR